ncbi:MAG TPA: hypothetical protein VGR78_02615, partial [Verrucomicrobiae bacterium]|jgi:hypothetical protein|nr:hypothetical protein [Verrucomicrobiae bacterium]
VKAEDNRWNSNQAYYHAENALDWAGQLIADANAGGPNAAFLGRFSVSGENQGSVSVPYLQILATNAASGFKNAWVTITNHPSGIANLYLVTASAQVMGKVRTIQASIVKNPPSLVFDYEYFLNNWGWWWGSSITGDGDNRANWDFDFRDSPTVNGSVLANGHIASNEVPVDPLSRTTPFAGTAASDPLDHVHSGAPRLAMPNLLDFSYYKAKAVSQGGKLYLGSSLIVNAVQTNATQTGLYLKGTSSNPIKIQGPVVVPGDVIIGGPITGQGTLYVGGNLYVAGDVTYANGPDFSSPPMTMTQSQTDQWVQNAASGNKDLVAFGVRGSVFGGDVGGSDFQTWCYYASGWGLVNLGDESNLGQDGIRGTPDDGISYPHYIGTNYVNNASYDADNSGVIDHSYNLTTDILMTSSRAAGILNYPTDSSGPVGYSTIATSSYNRMDGIYYCNHAAACRMAKNSQAVWNGAVICRDEAIVFNSSLKFNYDPRIHSRYSTDPNRVIDLGLPVANLVRIQQIDEIAPIAGFYPN